MTFSGMESNSPVLHMVRMTSWDYHWSKDIEWIAPAVKRWADMMYVNNIRHSDFVKLTQADTQKKVNDVLSKYF